MGLRHAVLTSVDRDDLEDGGAGQFVATVHALRKTAASVTVEVLIPDFCGSHTALDRVAASGPQVLNHNLETVRRLQGMVRPDGTYDRSLGLLARVKKRYPQVLTKSGLMVGLGETDAELLAACADLAAVGCDILTLGQYLRPGRDNLPVDRYLSPDGFGALKARALEMGFKHVAAAPLVRSSFNAGAVLKDLAICRESDGFKDETITGE
jgi:lipoic acid synthetase